MKSHKVIIATGGTGGHLFPAKHLAKQLKEKNIDVAFAGSKSKFSKFEGEVFFSISTSNIRKKNLIKPLFKIFLGTIQSVKLIKKFKPKVIIGFGSFHCFPILFAAKLLRIPYVIYEPNAVCGMVNRIFSKKAFALAVQFEEISRHKSHNIIKTNFLPWKKIEETSKEAVLSRLCLDCNRFTLLISGGSQGALFLNDLILKAAEKLKDKNIQIIHITGNEKTTSIAKRKYTELNIGSYVTTFVDDVPFYCLGASLAICRSGAGTIGDLIQTFTPSILIPYPYATDEHQYVNAKIMQEKTKGAKVFVQKDLTEEKLIQAIEDFMHNDCQKLHNMKEKIKEFYFSENKRRVFLSTIVEDICLRKNTTY